MQYDILEALNQIAVEKNMEIDYVIETLKASLVSAARKKYGDGDNISREHRPSLRRDQHARGQNGRRD